LARAARTVSVETNFLLNPRHPAFARIVIGEPEALVTDLRLTVRKTPAG
jgi:RES domain-containing protein